jgi:hypothetical protein
MLGWGLACLFGRISGVSVSPPSSGRVIHAWVVGRGQPRRTAPYALRFRASGYAGVVFRARLGRTECHSSTSVAWLSARRRAGARERPRQRAWIRRRACLLVLARLVLARQQTCPLARRARQRAARPMLARQPDRRSAQRAARQAQRRARRWARPATARRPMAGGARGSTGTPPSPTGMPCSPTRARIGWSGSRRTTPSCLG